jgi:hypothetical protein
LQTRKMLWFLVTGSAGFLLALVLTARGGTSIPPTGSPLNAPAAPCQVGPRRSVASLRAQNGSDIQVDPGAPDYDPLVLYRAGVSGFQLWAEEPRDEGWAPAMEARLGPQIQSDLAVMVPGGVEEVNLECKSATCKVSAVVPAPLVRSLNRALSIVDYGDSTYRDQQSKERLTDGRLRYSVVVFFNAGRDLDRHDREYRQRRESQLAAWRDRLTRSAEGRRLTPRLPEK